MKIAKRLILFFAVNILIILTISIVTSVLGIQPYLQAQGIDYISLMIFCVLWGFGGALISLVLSRKMAKWMIGVKVINPDQITNNTHQWLVSQVYEYAKYSNIEVMPEVGIYESPELNAFATGPTKNRALVAVSTGLLEKMDKKEISGVLAHEVAHIANGDMITMTLVQGVVNSFVMFLARVAGWFVGQFVDEEKRHMTQFMVVILMEVVLGILGMLVVASFSRAREYRADKGGADLAGSGSMISALQALKANYNLRQDQIDDEPAIASLKISGKPSGLLKLFSTHPDLDDRIARLKESQI